MTAIQKISHGFSSALRAVVYALICVSGAGVLSMIGITCADVVLRRFGHPIIGAYDLVKIAGAISLAAAMPYTTAVKGHVAIEYFFHKLNRPSRLVVDSICRLLGIALFAFLSYRSWIYGSELFKSGQGTQTLQIPIFWLPYVISFSCAVVALVIVHNLLHPGREMIKP